jgi:hypothetical protein
VNIVDQNYSNKWHCLKYKLTILGGKCVHLIFTQDCCKIQWYIIEKMRAVIQVSCFNYFLTLRYKNHKALQTLMVQGLIC